MVLNILDPGGRQNVGTMRFTGMPLEGNLSADIPIYPAIKPEHGFGETALEK